MCAIAGKLTITFINTPFTSYTGADPGFLPGEGAKGLMTLYGMVMSDF